MNMRKFSWYLISVNMFVVMVLVIHQLDRGFNFWEFMATVAYVVIVFFIIADSERTN